MKRTLMIGLMLVTLVSLVSVPLRAQSSSTVTPDAIEVTLSPGKCSDESVSVVLGESPMLQLDVVLMIDVTGSMSEVLNSVTRSAIQIASDIQELVPDSSFALVTLADYPEFVGSDTDYPYRLDLDFTKDSEKLQSALGSISLADGGDTPESYLRALYESQYLNWRSGSRRVVILFGDSYPHDPDPGRDETLSTSDDIIQEDLLSDLMDANITVLGIYTNADVEKFYQTLAVRTGGQAFHLSDVNQVGRVIQGLVEETVTNIHTLTLSSTRDGWLSWSPDVYHDVPPGESLEFAVTLCVPDGTSRGDYDMSILVTGDGATLGSVPVLIHVPVTATATPAVRVTASPSSPHPSTSGGSAGGAGGVPVVPGVPGASALAGFQWWWLLIPLAVLLLVLLLWWLLGHRSTRGDVSKPTPRPAPDPKFKPRPKPKIKPNGADVHYGRSRRK